MCIVNPIRPVSEGIKHPSLLTAAMDRNWLISQLANSLSADSETRVAAEAALRQSSTTAGCATCQIPAGQPIVRGVMPSALSNFSRNRRLEARINVKDSSGPIPPSLSVECVDDIDFIARHGLQALGPHCWLSQQMLLSMPALARYPLPTPQSHLRCQEIVHIFAARAASSVAIRCQPCC